MNTIEEYKIIESGTVGSLVDEVNAALSEGWQPYGAPFIQGVSGGTGVYCWQAMVKFHQPTGGEKIAELRHV
jgi:hypothetical protein